jgi:hypothetical protein
MLPGWYAGRTSVYSFSSIQFELDFTGVLVWTASHPRGLMALWASQKDERKA